MTGRFSATVEIDRPIEEVFAFLAHGENDPKFSPRVLEISKTTDGPTGVGTVYISTAKDVRDHRVRAAHAHPLGGADEEPCDRHRGRLRPRAGRRGPNEGHGPGSLIAGLALRSARKGADDFGKAIKAAVEAT